MPLRRASSFRSMLPAGPASVVVLRARLSHTARAVRAVARDAVDGIERTMLAPDDERGAAVDDWRVTASLPRCPDRRDVRRGP